MLQHTCTASVTSQARRAREPAEPHICVVPTQLTQAPTESDLELREQGGALQKAELIPRPSRDTGEKAQEGRRAGEAVGSGGGGARSSRGGAGGAA